MEPKAIKPVNLVISAHSVLAPKNSVFIGTGDRQAKYATTIENSFIPWLMAAGKIDGSHRSLMEKQTMKELQTATMLSEKVFMPVVSLHILQTLASVANALKTDAPCAINLNYRLPPGCRINVSKVLVDFVKRHEEFLLELYAVLHPAQKQNLEPTPVKKDESPVIEES